MIRSLLKQKSVKIEGSPFWGFKLMFANWLRTIILEYSPNEASRCSSGRATPAAEEDGWLPLRRGRAALQVADAAALADYPGGSPLLGDKWPHRRHKGKRYHLSPALPHDLLPQPAPIPSRCTSPCAPALASLPHGCVSLAHRGMIILPISLLFAFLIYSARKIVTSLIFFLQCINSLFLK